MDESNSQSFHRHRKLPGCFPAHILTILLSSLFIALLPYHAAGEELLNSTSTWKLTHVVTNNQVRPAEHILKIKLSGDTLTGTLGNVTTAKHKPHVNEWPIKDGKFQGDEISFTVTHPVDAGHGDVTTSYQGRISGDTIKGTFKVEVLGHSLTRDWEAARLKE